MSETTSLIAIVGRRVAVMTVTATATEAGALFAQMAA